MNKDIIDPIQSKKIVNKTLEELKEARTTTNFEEWSTKDRVEILEQAEDLKQYAKFVKFKLFQSRVKSKLAQFQEELETELKQDKKADLTTVKANFEEKLKQLSSSIIQLQEELKSVA